jgi:hypothetical protein
MAENLQSVEKYMLDELSADEREQFEEHMFDCAICADKVQRNLAVIDNLKEVLREEPIRAEAPRPEPSWRRWLQIPSLVPAFAALALACVVGYQNFGGTAADVFPVAVLRPVQMASTWPVVLADGKSHVIPVVFRLDSGQPDAYTCTFVNTAQQPVWQLKTGYTTARDLGIYLPRKHFPAGHYQMLLRPASKPDSIAYPFEVVYSK